MTRSRVCGPPAGRMPRGPPQGDPAKPAPRLPRRKAILAVRGPEGFFAQLPVAGFAPAPERELFA
jgi:hypothetical protein